MNIEFEKYFGTKNLTIAWERVIRSTGRDVKDFFGIEIFTRDVVKNIERLSEKLVSSNYVPSRPFKYYEPKASRTHRTKTVLNIEDALVYQAIANIVAHANYQTLTEYNDFVFGSILNPEVEVGEDLLSDENAEFYFFDYYVPLYNRFVNSINKEISNNEIKFKLETDITGFFDSIPHSKLLIVLLKKFNISKGILDLLGSALNIWSGTRESITPGIGIPQGPAASFFFANVLLADLDKLVIENGYTYYRYMDDIRIYEESEEKLQNAMILIDNYLKGNALSLNTKKTSIEQIQSDRIKERKQLLSDYDLAEDDEISKGESIKRSTDLFNIFKEENNEDINDQLRNFNKSILQKDEAIAFCKREIIEVEFRLFQEFYSKKISEDHFQRIFKDEDFKREIIHLAFRWRSAINVLRTFSEPLLLADELIPIWLFGVEHMFWKANHFCWNLNQYGSNKTIKGRLLQLFGQFKNLEWVRYQILANLSLAQEFSIVELRKMFRDLKEETSDLTKLGYYKLLLSHLKRDQQLFSALNSSIIQEPSSYIRQMLFIYQAKKDGNPDLSILKNWLGL